MGPKDKLDSTFTVDENALLRAAEWAAHFRNGGRAQPIPSPIRMQAGEELFLQQPTHVLQHTAQQVTYQQGGFLAVGNVGFLAASAIGSAMLNNKRRRDASRMAAAQWRDVDQGTLYLTNQRVALQLSQGWHDMWFAALRASQVDINGLILWADGWPPTKLWTGNHVYVLVLLRHLSDDEEAAIDIPPELRAKAAADGRRLPALPGPSVSG